MEVRFDSEVRKLIGSTRVKAIEDQINSGGKTTPDDFRCDAEQVEIDKNGRVRKSQPAKITNPSKK